MKVGKDGKRKCRDVVSCNGNTEENRTIQSNRHYGFISYFGATVRQMKATNATASITKEVRREIAMSFKNLPPKTKWKYKVQVQKPVKGEATNNFFTRCAPDRLAVAVSNLCDKQKAAICEMGLGSMLQLNSGRLKRKLCGWLVDRIDVGRPVLVVNGNEVELSANSFGHIMGLKDGGMPIELEGDITDIEPYLQMFNASSRGINIKKLTEILSSSTAGDDRFKVTFMLFALCTVLCPPGGVHISCSFLFSLKDVNRIQKRNWATFCFHRFIQGITRYKEENLAYIGGCLLYLEILYFNSILYGKVQRDRSMCPLALWNADEIKRLMKWIESKGGYGSDEIRVCGAPHIWANSRWDGCSRCAKGDISDRESGDMAIVPGMVKVKGLSQLEKPTSISRGPLGSVNPKDQTCSSVSSVPGNNTFRKDWSEAVDREGGCNDFHIKELYDNSVCDCLFIKSKAVEKEVCGQLQETESVHPSDSDINTRPLPPWSENLHTNIHIEEPIVDMLLSSEPSKSFAAVMSKSPDIQICADRARYRVGPYLMRRPFSSDEEKLINFCMDEQLNKGDMVYKTNFNCISRYDIMSLSPRTTINVKIVSAVSELLSAHASDHLGHTNFNLFLPSYNVDNVAGESIDLTFTFKQFIGGDLYLNNIGSCQKIFVPVNHGCAHWYLLVVLISEKSRVEIWDPLPSTMHSKMFIVECKHVLRSIDTALQHCGLNTVFGRLNLMDSPIEFCTRQPSVQHEYDCALYVILMMERHKSWSCLTEAEIKFDSDSERARIVIELMMFSFNSLKDKVRLLSDKHQMHLDHETFSICQAIDKRRLCQIRRSRQMGHGRRH